jgi:putative DNA primase/helicase
MEGAMLSGKPLAVIVENIPVFLRSLLWSVWMAVRANDSSNRFGKVPTSAIDGVSMIGVSRPEQWTSFEVAVAAYHRRRGDGVGVLLCREDSIIGIDLDNALDENGFIKPWADPIVKAVPSYWERSVSGYGLHGFLRGTLPQGLSKQLPLGDGRVEVYTSGRYLTVTGHRMPSSTEDVLEHPQGVQWLAGLMRVTSGPTAEAAGDTSPAPLTGAPPAQIGAIVEGCAWMRHCKDDAATLPEPEWYATLSVLGRCAGGDTLAHQWSALHPNYTPAETSSKLEQARRRSGPVTCQFVASGLGQSGFCATCPNCGRIQSPIVLGMGRANGSEWPEPERLESDHTPVLEFDLNLLPDIFRPFVADLSERLQVRPDFVAVALLVAFSGVTGRRARIRMKRFDDWEECANLWGAIVADPGAMKTPVIKRVLKIVNRMEEEAAQIFAEAQGQYEREHEEWENRKRIWKQEQSGAESSATFDEPEPVEPTCIRLLVNDATVPKLQELHSENPAGLLLFRDEIAGWLAALDSKGRESERPFFLEAWGGDQSFTYDRVTRGTVRASRICLAVLGGIQPTVLRRYVLGAIVGGDGDDGLSQRLQVVTYPDPLDTWVNVDREPDRVAEDAVERVFRSIATAPPERFVANFSPEAQEYFDAWHARLQRRLRNDPMPSYLLSHVAKYRGLFGRIALLCHIADSGLVAEIPLRQVERAAGWCQYLESHARRIYGEGSPRSIAVILGDKIRTGALGKRFTLRELQKKGWTGLAHHNTIRAVLKELEDCGWIRKEPSHKSELGGRRPEAFLVNPRLLSEGCEQ